MDSSRRAQNGVVTDPKILSETSQFAAMIVRDILPKSAIDQFSADNSEDDLATLFSKLPTSRSDNIIRAFSAALDKAALTGEIDPSLFKSVPNLYQNACVPFPAGEDLLALLLKTTHQYLEKLSPGLESQSGSHKRWVFTHFEPFAQQMLFELLRLAQDNNQPVTVMVSNLYPVTEDILRFSPQLHFSYKGELITPLLRDLTFNAPEDERYVLYLGGGFLNDCFRNLLFNIAREYLELPADNVLPLDIVVRPAFVYWQRGTATSSNKDDYRQIMWDLPDAINRSIVPIDRAELDASELGVTPYKAWSVADSKLRVIVADE